MYEKNDVSRKQNIVVIGLLILSVLASISKILVGFDIDEAYAVAMPFRLCQGEGLFRDLWEVHQTSSFLPALFVMLFYKITGSVTGLVIYLRIVTTVIHFLFSIWCYLILKKHYHKYTAVLVAIGYYNFLPKWMINIDFSMQQLWFMTMSILFLYYGMKKVHHIWYVLSGVALAFAVLAYPGMVFLYPVYLLVILYIEKEHKIKKILLLTLGCLMMAILFFTYVFSYMSVGEFIQSIPMVFSDGSHQFSLETKLLLHLKQWVEVLIQSVILLVPTMIVTFLYGKLEKIKVTVYEIGMVFLWLWSGIFVLAAVLPIGWGPFRLQVRYIILFVLAFLLYHQQKKKEQVIFSLILVPSLFMFLGILLSSNVGPASSASYLVLGDLGFVLLFMNHAESRESEQKHVLNGKWVYHGAVVIFIVSLILCKGYFVRVTEYAPGKLIEKRVAITEGAAKGIFVYPEDYNRTMDNYETMLQNIEKGEQILFLGTEALSNLTAIDKEAGFVSPTTISTPAFNEQWTIYFEKYKDKMPDKIFIAKNTIDNREKFFAKNDFGKWIGEHYDVEHMEETDYLCVIGRK